MPEPTRASGLTEFAHQLYLAHQSRFGRREVAVSEEAAFLRAIIADPADPGPRLVFADWLEEQGDPRGPPLRKPGGWWLGGQLWYTNEDGYILRSWVAGGNGVDVVFNWPGGRRPRCATKYCYRDPTYAGSYGWLCSICLDQLRRDDGDPTCPGAVVQYRNTLNSR